jgi:cell division protein FtsZ
MFTSKSSYRSDYSGKGGDSFANSMNSFKQVPAAKIKVVGVGGGGGNTVNRMIEVGVEGVEFWVMNTDLQVLKQIHADGVIQLGPESARGLGAGGNPEVGRQAAEESIAEIEAALAGADMVFITAGMGGGTGTGASPVIAEVAKRMGILTVSVVTKPFNFEREQRMIQAVDGIERLKTNADACITIPNQKILQVAERNTSVFEAFRLVDDVLRQAVQGISDLINFPGEVNLDFADVRSIMTNAGTALMGMGKATGERDRAAKAALMAIDSPLLELSIDGAKGVLFNITGGKNLSIFEIEEAAEIINKYVDPEAKIIFGNTIDPNMTDEVRITVIATGFPKEKEQELMNSRNYTKREDAQTFQAPKFGGLGLKPSNNGRHTDEEREKIRLNEYYGSANTEANDPSNPRNPAYPTTQDDSESWEVPAFLRKKFKQQKDN